MLIVLHKNQATVNFLSCIDRGTTLVYILKNHAYCNVLISDLLSNYTSRTTNVTPAPWPRAAVNRYTPASRVCFSLAIFTGGWGVSRGEGGGLGAHHFLLA